METDSHDITLEQRKEEIDAIFSDEELLRCMEVGLHGHPVSVEPETPRDVKMRRMLEALDAFSKNPPEWWAFS